MHAWHLLLPLCWTQEEKNYNFQYESNEHTCWFIKLVECVLPSFWFKSDATDFHWIDKHFEMLLRARNEPSTLCSVIRILLPSRSAYNGFTHDLISDVGNFFLDRKAKKHMTKLMGAKKSIIFFFINLLVVFHCRLSHYFNICNVFLPNDEIDLIPPRQSRAELW